MEIVYKDETLFVDVLDNIDNILIKKLENRVFRIIDDYDIDNIVVNILSDKEYDKDLLQIFLNSYHEKYKGKLKIV